MLFALAAMAVLLWLLLLAAAFTTDAGGAVAVGASEPEPGPAEVVLLTVPLDELETCGLEVVSVCKVTECCPEVEE